MKKLFLGLTIPLALFCFSFSANAGDTPAAATTAPVLVELFTSEGCSSCPPADAMLKKLDSLQPVPGTQLIVLSEHVDYWNHDGWTDPYSSSTFTERQNEYKRNLHLASPYTPQMVVDGAAQVNGSDSAALAKLIGTARAQHKLSVQIPSAAMDGNKVVKVRIEAEAIPESAGIHKADIFVAIALNHAESHVLKGENKGRDIDHVAVVLALKKIGTVEQRAGFQREAVIKLPNAADPSNLRVIAFIQKPDAGPVLGVSLVSIAGDAKPNPPAQRTN